MLGQGGNLPPGPPAPGGNPPSRPPGMGSNIPQGPPVGGGPPRPSAFGPPGVAGVDLMIMNNQKQKKSQNLIL